MTSSLERKLLLEQEILELEEQLSEESRLLESYLRQEEYAKSEESFYRYYMAAWPQFESVPFLSNWHLQAMAEHLEAVYTGQIQNLLVNIPPRTSKCLDSATTLLMADGSTKLLKDITVFDEVKSIGGKTDTVIWKEYTGHHPLTYIELENGNSCHCTHNHKFLRHQGLARQWRAAEDLKVGDSLVCAKGSSPIAKIEVGVKEAHTFDIQTAKYNCFQIDKGLISHNSSMINVAFPTWIWLKDPTTKFITASNSESLAVRDSTRSRSVIQSPWYQAKWGGKFQLRSDVNQKSKYENNRHGYRIATSIGGKAIGEGFDILLCDDPHKPIEVVSKKGREAVIDWWTNTMSSRANSPSSKRILIMQRLHEEDLSGFILEHYASEWEHLCIPMEYEPTSRTTILGFRDPRTKEGQCLWPERFPPDTLQSLKRNLREFGTASQLQQRPVPLGGGLVKKSWLKWYSVPQAAADFDKVITSWDLSFGAGGDYTVGTVWGIRNQDKYLLDMYRGQWDIVQQIEHILKALTLYPNTYANLVEDRANGRGVVDMLKRHIARLVPVNPMGDKESRLVACCPEIEGGYVYLPNHSIKRWVSEVEHELTNFPRAKHDDIVDSFSQALNWISQQGVGRVTTYVENPETITIPGRYPSNKEPVLLTPVSYGEIRKLF